MGYAHLDLAMRTRSALMVSHGARKSVYIRRIGSIEWLVSELRAGRSTGFRPTGGVLEVQGDNRRLHHGIRP